MFSPRWSGVPRAVQLIIGAEVVVLSYGAAVHIVQLVAGDMHPYSWAPTWLAAYFTALTLADPLAAVLLAARKATGLYLGAAIFVTDAIANGYAIYGLHNGPAMAWLSQVVISILAVAAVAVAPRVLPWLSRGRWVRATDAAR